MSVCVFVGGSSIVAYSATRNDGNECSCVSVKIRMTMNRVFFPKKKMFPPNNKC